MKEKLKIMLKGMVFGIANIIPGVSGGTIALTLGIYEDLIKALSNILKSFKKSMSLLIPFGLGTAISIVVFSKIINYTLTKFPTMTILFFIGLIIGGLPLITEKVKGKKVKVRYIVLMLLTFAFILGISFLNENGNNVVLSSNPITYILLFLVGVVAAATMVIPGISGSFVLMLLGYYKPIINTIDELTSFNNVFQNILILIPFGLGVVIGIITIAKLLEYLFKKYKTETYYAIIGFIVASIITLFLTINLPHNLAELILSLVFLIIGILCGYKLGDK